MCSGRMQRINSKRTGFKYNFLFYLLPDNSNLQNNENMSEKNQLSDKNSYSDKKTDPRMVYFISKLKYITICTKIESYIGRTIQKANSFHQFYILAEKLYSLHMMFSIIVQPI